MLLFKKPDKDMKKMYIIRQKVDVENYEAQGAGHGAKNN
jgi:hypothetical protein